MSRLSKEDLSAIWYEHDIAKAVTKAIKDWRRIAHGNGWENPFLQQYRCYFRQFDVFDDCQMGLSLKAIEAHRGKNILETEVDFDLDRPLTEEELQSTIGYWISIAHSGLLMIS